jgi:hypothetical protein
MNEIIKVNQWQEEDLTTSIGPFLAPNLIYGGRKVRLGI